jgi:hypothetical protein
MEEKAGVTAPGRRPSRDFPGLTNKLSYLAALGVIPVWAGETVTRTGPVPSEAAMLYTRSDDPPGLDAAALTPETAEWPGAWAAVNQPAKKLPEMIERFRRSGGEGKPRVLQVHVGYGRTDKEPRRLAWEQWRPNIVDPRTSETLCTPEEFDAATADVQPEGSRPACPDLGRESPNVPTSVSTRSTCTTRG